MPLLVAWGDTWTLQRLHRQSKLFQDSTSIFAIARRFVVSPSTDSRAWRRFQETGSYSERPGQDCRRSLTHQQYRYILLCARKWMSTARALQNDLQQATGVNVSDQTIRNRLHEWRPIWALCSLPSTAELDWHLPLNARIGRSATGTLCFLQRAGSPWAHVTDVKGSGEAVENITLPVTSFSMTGLVVGQWWSGEAYPRRDAQTSTGETTAIKYRDEILGPIVRPYAGAVGPGFLLVHGNAQPRGMQAVPGGWRNWYHWMAPTLAWPKSNRKPLGHCFAARLHLRFSGSSVMPWSRPTKDTIRHLIRSMPRCQACIQARGGHTN